MTKSTRDAFLSLALKRQKLTIPELGDVYIREFTSQEASEFQAMSTQLMDGTKIRDAKRLAELTARVLIWAVVDENGDQVFNEDDLPAVMALPNRIVDKIATSVLDLSGQGQGAVETAKKGSNGMGGGDSSSA